MESPSPFERLYGILHEAAKARETVTDRTVMARLGWNDHGPVRRMQLEFLLRSLSYIQSRMGGVPMLAAVVVAEDTGRPDDAFFETAQSLRHLGANDSEDVFWLRELARVYAFWAEAA